MTRFSVRPDQNDATAQLMSHATQVSASSWVGQVAVHPLQKKAKSWLESCGMGQDAFPDCIDNYTGDSGDMVE